MKLLRDFHCDFCGTTTERFIESTTRQVLCDCGEIANRVIGTPRVSLEGISGDFPTASDRWANIREQNARVKAKRREVSNY